MKLKIENEVLAVASTISAERVYVLSNNMFETSTIYLVSGITPTNDVPEAGANRRVVWPHEEGMFVVDNSDVSVYTNPEGYIDNVCLPHQALNAMVMLAATPPLVQVAPPYVSDRTMLLHLVSAAPTSYRSE